MLPTLISVVSLLPLFFLILEYLYVLCINCMIIICIFLNSGHPAIRYPAIAFLGSDPRLTTMLCWYYQEFHIYLLLVNFTWEQAIQKAQGYYGSTVHK